MYLSTTLGRFVCTLCVYESLTNVDVHVHAMYIRSTRTRSDLPRLCDYAYEPLSPIRNLIV